MEFGASYFQIKPRSQICFHVFSCFIPLEVSFNFYPILPPLPFAKHFWSSSETLPGRKLSDPAVCLIYGTSSFDATVRSFNDAFVPPEFQNPAVKTCDFVRSWGVPSMGNPQMDPNGWFIMENPKLKWMIWGSPYFRNPPHVFHFSCLRSWWNWGSSSWWWSSTTGRISEWTSPWSCGAFPMWIKNCRFNQPETHGVGFCYFFSLEPMRYSLVSKLSRTGTAIGNDHCVVSHYSIRVHSTRAQIAQVYMSY